MSKQKDNLLEFTIPNWALASLINGDYSGLEDEDIEKIDKFVNKTVDKYGNANFMLPDESEMDLGFEPFNDIDKLGSDCSLLYLRPSKKFGEGGETDDEISKLYKGYLEAVIFTEEENLGSYYTIYDFDKATQKSTKDMLTRFYNENESAIKESGLDLDTIGNDIWYTRSGQGAGFFDHSLDDDVEKKLINSAKKLGEYPSVEENKGKISISKGRIFAEGGETDENEEEEDENEKRLEELVDEYDIPAEVIKEYASDRGMEISEIDDLPYNGTYNSEEDYAKSMVDEGVVGDLSYYLEMYPTDMRILAQELADSRVDNMDDDDILSETDMEEEAQEQDSVKAEIEDLENDIDDLKSKYDDYMDEEDEDMTEGEREMREEKSKEMQDEIDEKGRELYDLHDKYASMDSYDEVVEKAKEQLREESYDMIYDALNKDAVGYFVDELGYRVEDFTDNNLFTVDYEKLARELGYDVLYINHRGEVYVFSNYEKGGMTYAKGGGIPNNYEKFNNDDEKIWNAWSKDQKTHFLLDHHEQFKNVKFGIEDFVQTGTPMTYYVVANFLDYKDLPFLVKDSLRNHIIEGQYANGGEVHNDNKEMLKNQAVEVKHHSEELMNALQNTNDVEAWVVAKMERATTDLSDITHYLDGQSKKMAKGGKSQGYDDREDERLGMEDGKISDKDFVGSHKKREHSRRDDARFEERMADGGMMAKGGVIKKGSEVMIDSEPFIVANSFTSIKGDKTYFLVSKNEMKDKYGMIVTLTLTENQLRKKMMADGGMMAKGGGMTFDDKVESISKALLERKKVPKSVQKDYGKTFTKEEAIDSAKRLVGSMTKMERAKKVASAMSKKKN